MKALQATGSLSWHASQAGCETTAIAKSGDKTVNQVDTGGAYILMRQSEGAALVYYMKNGKFHEARIAG